MPPRRSHGWRRHERSGEATEVEAVRAKATVGTAPSRVAPIRRGGRRISSIALLVLAFARPAFAQPSEEDGRRAVTLGREAMMLYEGGRYAEAHDRFAAAEGVVHSPVFVLYMARAKRAVGELLAAVERYQRVRDETLSPDAPEPWRRAQAEANAELADLAPRVPTIHVEGTLAELFVNGTPVAYEGPLRVDPGRYVLLMRDGAGRQREEIVEVREGDALHVAFPPAEIETEGPLWPGGLLLGLGIAGLTVGTITGTIAKVEADDIKSRCLGDSCLEVDAGRADQARALATASTASFVAGGALAAVGVVLLIVRPGGAPNVAIDLRPGGLLLHGRF
jgi:hypothetical protein